MGRKKRRGRTKFYQIQPHRKSQAPANFETIEHYVRHLDRPGQRDQFVNVLKEVPAPGDIPSSIAGYHGTYTLQHCWRVPDPSRKEFYQHLRNPQNLHRRLFHGTKEWAVPYIVLQSFKLPRHSGMFGKAVYLTPDIMKAVGFTNSRRPMIFVAEAVLGRVETMAAGQRDLDQISADAAGFDTAHGKSGSTMTWSRPLIFSEYAVYDPTRICIRYLLEYGSSL